MMKRIVLLGLGWATAAVALQARAVVSDVQVMQRDASSYVVETRSTDAQAFDVIPTRNPQRFTVRLYGANLARTAPLGRTAFGRVRLRARSDGNILLRVRLRRGWHAVAVQGHSPNAVDVRITR